MAQLQSIDSGAADIRQLQRDIAVREKELIRAGEAQEKINVLYERADIYLGRGRADGADKLWVEISRLDPNNKGLAELGTKIAAGYVVMAQREIDGQDWKDVLVWVERGLKYVPDQPQLLEQQKLANEKLASGCRSGGFGGLFGSSDC